VAAAAGEDDGPDAGIAQAGGAGCDGPHKAARSASGDGVAYLGSEWRSTRGRQCPRGPRAEGSGAGPGGAGGPVERIEAVLPGRKMVPRTQTAAVAACSQRLSLLVPGCDNQPRPVRDGAGRSANQCYQDRRVAKNACDAAHEIDERHARSFRATKILHSATADSRAGDIGGKNAIAGEWFPLPPTLACGVLCA